MTILTSKKSPERRILADGGIYSITCTANGKVYIGSTVGFKRRWYEHRNDLKRGKHCSPYLQNAYNKYGVESFDFQVVEYIKYADELLETEQRWIYWYQSHDNEKGFNVCPVAGYTTYRILGDAEKKKISEGLRRYHLRRRESEGVCTINDVAIKKREPKYTLGEITSDGTAKLMDLTSRDLKKIASVFRIRYSYMSKLGLRSSLLIHPRISEFEDILVQSFSEQGEVLSKLPPRTSRVILAKELRELEKADYLQARRDEELRLLAVKESESIQKQDLNLSRLSRSGFTSIELFDMKALKLSAQILKIKNYSYLTKAVLLEKILSCDRVGIIKEVLPRPLVQEIKVALPTATLKKERKLREKVNQEPVLHGVVGSPEYKIWKAMRNRCLNKKNVSYHKYGGKGIKIDKRWNSFANFYKDMGDRSEDASLKRIDTMKNYSKDNCQWASKSEAGNRSNDVYIIVDGEKMRLNDVAKEWGILPNTLYKRIFYQEMSVEEALGK